MKVLLIVTVLAASIYSCSNKSLKTTAATRENLPAAEKKILDSLYNDSNGVFKWIDSLQTLQNLKDGEVISTSFRFKNAGSTLLFIKKAQGSCGCTKVDYPPTTLQPGEEGRIEITFDSKGKSTDSPTPTALEKTITVEANTAQQIHTAVFKVMVSK